MKTCERADEDQRRYACLADFYNADPRRLSSRELDVGLWWREDCDGPLHRAAWVRDTGELYLVRSGDPSAGGGAVEVLARVDSSDAVESGLEGWREHCGEARSLSWLRARSARLREGRRPRRAGQRPETPRRKGNGLRLSVAQLGRAAG